MDWKNTFPNILNKIKTQLHSKKLDDLSSVYKVLNDCDKDRSGTLDRDEFTNFLTKIGVFLTVQEFRTISDIFDKNQDN